MSNCSRGKRPQSARQIPARTGMGAPAARPEPEMRRWPHPIVCEAEEPAPQSLTAALHYIRCALSYQNQLLAEIRTLLEAAVPEPPAEQERK